VTRPRAGKAAVSAALGLQFLLELGVLGALAYSGITASASTGVRWLLALGAPALATAFWAVFGAPRAPLHARGAARTAVELGFFGSAVCALIACGQPWIAMAFGSLVIANITLLRSSASRTPLAERASR
jgi:Protein of unknown function (DUF2568)